jgi:hypothetical protein
MEDINDLLKEAPTHHTFIILKNMFYASKTMHDAHVGVMWDRVGGKDDTNLQSLLGRACGYNKSSTTIVYTSGQTVTRYLKFWREVIGGGAVPVGVDAAHLDKKMPGQRVKAAAAGGGTPVLQVVPTYATPVGIAAAAGGGGGGGGGPVTPPRAKRVAKNADDYVAETRRFASFAEAKKWGKGIQEPKKVDGFYQTSTTGAARTQRYDEVVAFCSGKKTAGLPKIDVGKSVNRKIVGYRDLTDPESGVWFVRRITRVK